MRKIAVAVVLVARSAAFAAADANLRALAVKNGDGSIKVLHESDTTSFWSGEAQCGYHTVFDENTRTAVDPALATWDTWAGYELSEPRVVTRIRFCGRTWGDGEDRIRSCYVQGANESDFSDAVTLLDLSSIVPAVWREDNPSGWFEAPARSFSPAKTFRFLRIIQPSSGEKTFCGNVAELEFYGVAEESYADYVPNVTEETNLKFYAIYESTGSSIDVFSDGAALWTSGCSAAKVYDGVLTTFYDPKDNTAKGSYAGYALAKPMAVTRIRYYGYHTPGAGHTERLLYCEVQAANEADFSDAVTIHLCTNSVPADWHLHPSWIDVVPDATAGTNTFKYLRFINPDGKHQCGTASEVEFYGMSPGALATNVLDNPTAPTNLRADMRGGFPGVGTILRWEVQPGVSESTVLRAPGQGGPWTEFAVHDASAWEDTSAPAGSVMYYRVATRFSMDGRSVSCTNDAIVPAIRRWRLLERDPNEMDHLRSGVGLISRCGQKCWTPAGTSTTWAGVTNSLLLAFNGVLWSGSTETSSAGYKYNVDYADVLTGSPRTCIGVDLGEPAHFACMRFYSCSAEKNKGRVTGVVLSGSNDGSAWYETGNFSTLTSPLVWSMTGQWHQEGSLDAETAYRYLFCHNEENNVWGCNVSELQLYGWLESDLAALAQGVEDFSAEVTPAGSVSLAWTVKNGYGTYSIERLAKGSAEWQTVASGISATAEGWTDTAITGGSRYTYRVKTVNGANVAYSLGSSVVIPNGMKIYVR